MRILLIFSFIFFGLENAYAQNKPDDFFSATDAFYSIYVKDGRVNYKAIQENPILLDNLMSLASTVSVSTDNENTYKSFWINAYNLSVIRGIVNSYPVTSPLNVPGFFDESSYFLAGEQITINDIENEKLREVYHDPEFHFVLVCGALGCPPIIAVAYRSEILDVQMERQTRLALNNSDFIQVNPEEQKAFFSEIMKWYERDFIQQDISLIDFVNAYRDEKIPEDYEIDFYPYNWQLNEFVEVESGANYSDTILQQRKSNIMEYTPSKLMKLGKWDLKLFNNLYTQTREVDEFGKVMNGIGRSTFFTSTLEAYAGVSKNARLNIGIIVNLKSNIGGNNQAVEVFKFETVQGVSRAGISSIAPSVKVSPFKKVSNFSIQSSLHIPVFADTYGSFFLDKRSFVWDNKFYYDKTIAKDKFQIFGEIDLAYSFGSRADFSDTTINSSERYANNSLGVPISLSFNYFPTPMYTLFAFSQYFALIDLGNNFSQQYALAGAGMKVQLTSHLNLELSTSFFFWGRSSGLGETYNLGLRYIL